MIVEKRFPSDENRVLMEVQFDVFRSDSGVRLLCDEAQRRYHQAVRLTGTETALWSGVKRHRETFHADVHHSENGLPIQHFEHRVLAGAYERIAAAFRYCNAHLWHPRMPPDVAALTRTWVHYWVSEVRRLMDQDEIVIAVLTAVVFHNEERGREAAKKLAELLDREYQGAPPLSGTSVEPICVG